jgi:glutathione S-transferase
MTLKLYYSPGACSFVPHALLETAGVPFEPLLVKIHRRENYDAAFKAVNPRSQVPVLVDGDQTLTQIVAIIGYLDARFPDQHWLPREPLARARAMETLMWMNNTVHPTFTHVFMPDKFAATPEARADIKAFHVPLYRDLVGEIEAMARVAAAEDRPWLGGAQFGPIDAYALTLLRWAGLAGIDPTGFPALWPHIQKVAALPAVARAIERERLQLNLYKPA